MLFHSPKPDMRFLSLFASISTPPFYGTINPDTRSGGADDDTMYGLGGADIFNGGGGTDQLYGDAGTDTLNGDDGNDVIEGGADGDIMNGGAGTDYLSYYNGGAVNVSLDNSIAKTGVAIGDVFTNFENLHGSNLGADILGGNANANTINGFGGADEIYGFSGNDSLSGGVGADTLDGGIGNDVLTGGADADILIGGAGEDAVSYYNETFVELSLDGLIATAGAALGDRFFTIEQVWGSNTGNDKIAGNASANTLLGYGGNDSLYGRAGQDFLNGGFGEDQLYGDADNDTLIGGAGADRLFGGAGSDLVSYFNELGATVSLVAPAAAGSALGDVFNSIEDLSGSNTGDDNFTGNSAANRLFGNGGNDRLNGNSGDDILVGGLGRDSLIGGTGIDLVSYAADGAVRVSLDKSIVGTGAALGDTFSAVENVNGSQTGSDTISGNGVANALYGNGGNDKLYGRAGDDQLVGGTGADRLDGGTGTDTASYAASGAVVISMDGSLTSRGDAAGDVLVAIEVISGSFLGGDTLAGNGLANTLYGNGGTDKLYGRAGNDNLVGGSGADQLYGGTGADQFFIFSKTDAGDKIYDFSSADVLLLEGSGFGFSTFKGAVSAARFESNSSNVATQSSTRFIYRTGDDTLWFDADGKGSTKAMLVVDLATNYNFLANDMYII